LLLALSGKTKTTRGKTPGIKCGYDLSKRGA
jgi:hypothetical protein